jgi:hypothetical protein
MIIIKNIKSLKDRSKMILNHTKTNATNVCSEKRASNHNNIIHLTKTKMVYMSLETFNMNCICVYHSPLKTIAH